MLFRLNNLSKTMCLPFMYSAWGFLLVRNAKMSLVQYCFLLLLCTCVLFTYTLSFWKVPISYTYSRVTSKAATALLWGHDTRRAVGAMLEGYCEAMLEPSSATFMTKSWLSRHASLGHHYLCIVADMRVDRLSLTEGGMGMVWHRSRAWALSVHMLVSVGRGWGELLHEYPWGARWGVDKKDRLPARSAGILLWVVTSGSS